MNLPVDTSDDNGNVCNRQSDNEHEDPVVFEPCEEPLLGCRIVVAIGLCPLAQSHPVDDHETGAERHVGKLEADTGDEQGRADILELDVGLLASRGNASNGRTDRLDEDGGEVGADKDPRVPLRFDHGTLWTKVDDEVLGRNGDCSGHKRRTEDEEEQLNDKGRVRPRVIVHDDATDVTEELEERSHGEVTCEAPCFGLVGEPSLGDEEDEETNGEEDAGAEVEVIAVQGQLDGALRGDIVAGLVRGSEVWVVGAGGTHGLTREGVPLRSKSMKRLSFVREGVPLRSKSMKRLSFVSYRIVMG